MNPYPSSMPKFKQLKIKYLNSTHSFKSVRYRTSCPVTERRKQGHFVISFQTFLEGMPDEKIARLK